MSEAALVTIAIPTCNGARWLKEAIDSALAQTYLRTEILVVDDASDDDTVELAESIPDARVRVLRNERRLGLAGNWNRCIAEARGKYIKFLFQDDLLHPDCVAELLGLMEASPSVGLAFSPRAIELEDPGDRIMQRWEQKYGSVHRGFGRLERVNSGRALFDRQAGVSPFANWIGEPSVVMVRTDLVRELGGFNPRLRQLVDAEMWLRLMFRADVGFVDRELSTFRVHRRSATAENQSSSAAWLDPVWMAEGLLADGRIRQDDAALSWLRMRALPRVLRSEVGRVVRRRLPAVVSKRRDVRAYVRYRCHQHRVTAKAAEGDPFGARKLRVLLVLHEMSQTGAPRLALSVFSGLREELDIRIVSERAGALEPYFRSLGHVTVLRRGPATTAFRHLIRAESGLAAVEAAYGRVGARFITATARGWRPDIVYLNSVAVLPTYARMGRVRGLRAPTVLHVHEGPLALARYEATVPGLIGEVADRYIAVSEVVRDALVRSGAPSGRVSVVHPQVDARWLDRVEVVDRESPGIGEPRPLLVGGAGAPGWTKGFDLWLLTAAELVRLYGRGRYRFKWIGVQADEAGRKCGAMVEELGLGAVVDLAAATPDPVQAFSELDVMLVSSREEAASLVTLESMALGKVVACFRGSGGPAELLGPAGIVVAEFSPVDMASAIAALADDPSRRLALGNAARSRAADRYTAETQLPRILAEIRAAVAARGTPTQ